MSLWGFDTLAPINAQMWHMSIPILPYIYLHRFIQIPLFYMKNDKTIKTIAETTLVLSMYWKCCRQLGFLGKLNTKALLKVKKIYYFSS